MTIRYRRVLSRRTMLRGAGTVAVGLPLLEEMSPRSVWATPPEPPARAITVFFGLGCPWQFAAEGYEGGLEPLKEFEDRLTVFRGLNLGDGNGFHWDGGAAVFTGAGKRGNSNTRGPSLDHIIRTHHHPNGVPDGVLTTLNTGYFFRRGEPNPEGTRIRIFRSWDDDGNVTDPPKEYPIDVFNHVFGEAPGMPEDPTLRTRRSILDSVLDDYSSLCGERAGLGAKSRARICDHLDQIRELEKQITGAGLGRCAEADAPTPTDITGGQDRDTGGDVAINLELDDWVSIWRQHADVYALALKCDRARFGNIMHQSAGERINLRGEYTYQGRHIHTFDWDLQPQGSHEHFHNWKSSQTDEDMVRNYLHLTMNELVYFFKQLDDPESLDANGKTIFDNAFLIMGTELGDGSGPHDTTRVLHALGPANGRFATGGFNDHMGNGVDLYNTCAQGLGIDRFVGSDQYYSGTIPGIIA